MFVKHELKCAAYLKYMDDCGFILFPTRRRLRCSVTDLTPQPPSRFGKGEILI